ncbi:MULTISPECIES: 2-polyprenyl-3-methyl-6-methoxy-1,4-benzoquinone monooxygenase [Legionella]|uniref:3-demethoxyubiquinol 3-hydroxylase n=1 Tax=Legionella septentrionalis TaxID=2498109 RepID=A0A433JK52_9GAMM|nr:MULTISPECIES: 2-polyprenyl-3-methyl-6-methoxy-1,4-benzoquinone monooxygenase [Legionella]MCP0914890.1 2-polyprenyl-3-methyl-6-methoxy-1,4-benzoquinone monooxygenase [Legionella sp. 27cVA30]RUQ88839.1 2-polyprenyl-3-methyl-6-methoxy-1,4-benzoquinone monooxygenase [Legionella septentrionalis]RUR02952.1 2-polyprenyl-3-methyl-6-methoxy-1,4-benzoquinone monooxygenase [Legionella septentrionalis]RUR11590.1 2-polyprenyl-3-methyl-6-methoxy-1,4-benzoquinone monooxygenase [Legionella septentrionalis]
MRQLNLFDKILSELDTTLRTLFIPQNRPCDRATPGEHIEEPLLTRAEKQHVAGLMRVNHAGEVCAQALYQGQALTAKLDHVKTQMAQAAKEEEDHLAWCEQRLAELSERPSWLNPLWYGGSFLIGALAGLAGDHWSLGFVAETERQVTAHLQNHLSNIPAQDEKTRAILTQMREDEELHRQTAMTAGAAELPGVVKYVMGKVSKLMTKSSYYI